MTHPALADDEQAICDIVRASPTASLAIELPSGLVLSANEPMATILGVDIESLVGSHATDLLAIEFREPARAALNLLSDGWLTGYQAIRQFQSRNSPSGQYALWFSAVQLRAHRIAIGSVVPISGEEYESPITKVPMPGGVALGTADATWRITRISSDVEDILGYRAEQCVGQAFLGYVHPADVATFLTGIEQARHSQRTVRIALRLRGVANDWIGSALFLETTSEDNPPAFGFALVESTPSDGHTLESNDGLRFEHDMDAEASELSAAGTMAKLQSLPECDAFPDLSRLTSREWQVLARLIDGERVKSIARHLYVSESTVRNHLSSIYSKFGVHSQSDLLLLVRDYGSRVG